MNTNFEKFNRKNQNYPKFLRSKLKCSHNFFFKKNSHKYIILKLPEIRML